MTRRKFAFWVGLGLFGLAEQLRLSSLDDLAASIMGETDTAEKSSSSRTPEHWVVNDDENWQWYEREHWIDDQWICTGTTTPIHKQTGEPCQDKSDCLDDNLVPKEVRVASAQTEAEAVPQLPKEPGEGQPDPARRARHGRPPSKWLRSLHADELRIWLETIDVPNAGVCGMTFWTHLTRDHAFDPAKIEGLTVAEQEKLHSAAHYGY